MMRYFLILLTFALLPLEGRIENSLVQGKGSGYNLSSPDQKLILPDKLREVSGLTILDSVTVAMIQDENGILFIYDLRENRIKAQVIFAGTGDYEDIALVNKTIFVLRSDGILFEITNFISKDFKVTYFKTGVPSSDIEGLCFDRINNRLLIGCKGDIRKENFKNRRAVYGFDLKTRKLIPEPVFVFDIESVNRLANTDNSGSKGDKGKKDKKDKKKKVEIRTSAIAIHPKTGKLFLLSATDNVLCIANKTGLVEDIIDLDNDIFPQAEGISFFPGGEMLITNEARDKKPTLLRFNYFPGR